MQHFHDTTPDAYEGIVDALSLRETQDSRIGDTKEILGVTVHSSDPRERLLFRENFNLAFALQERFAFWNGLNPGHVERYNSNMERYIQDDGEMLGSAYGRYFRHLPHDQIDRALDMLQETPETRRAVINVHNAVFEDYDSNDVACTIYLQPMIRDGELTMFANLRSQDMLWGYPYDTQAFQWIQEAMAGILGVDVGEFVYYVNSCHYYKEFSEQVLTSAVEHDVYSEPDCRLTRAELDRTMDRLQTLLERARRGVVPGDDQLDHVGTYSPLYGDWARLMVAYEQYRFHEDEDEARRVAADIGIDAWRTWMIDRLN